MSLALFFTQIGVQLTTASIRSVIDVEALTSAQAHLQHVSLGEVVTKVRMLVHAIHYDIK